jgi:hypothetical protein
MWSATGAVVRSDIYISADIESDGPIPGRYSMLSFGLAVAATFDGETFAPRDPAASTIGRELRPIATEYVPAALAVSGLDRDRLEREGADPAEAMVEAAEWVRGEAGEARPVMVGYPIVFDWMFMHWYFVRFCGASPFGFSGALDMKTMYHRRAGVTLEDLPPELVPDRPHTHDALADAIEQAEIFARLW